MTTKVKSTVVNAVFVGVVVALTATGIIGAINSNSSVKASVAAQGATLGQHETRLNKVQDDVSEFGGEFRDDLKSITSSLGEIKGDIKAMGTVQAQSMKQIDKRLERLENR